MSTLPRSSSRIMQFKSQLCLHPVVPKFWKENHLHLLLKWLGSAYLHYYIAQVWVLFISFGRVLAPILNLEFTGSIPARCELYISFFFSFGYIWCCVLPLELTGRKTCQGRTWVKILALACRFTACLKPYPENLTASSIVLKMCFLKYFEKRLCS